MRRLVMAVVVAAGVAGVWGPAFGAGVPRSPFGFAVFGLGDVKVRDRVRAIDGAVGSNDGTTTVGKDVRVNGAVVGRTIRLRNGAMPGDLFCLLLESGATGLACQAVGLPVFDGTLLPSVQVSPGSTAINIPPRGRTSPIPAGNYGKLNIRSGGVLRLEGGSYTFRSINVGPRAQLLCTGACDIGVAGAVRTQERSTLAGDGGAPAAMRLNIASAKRNRAAFSGGKRATISAVVYAPKGRIELRDGGNFVGSYVGATVSVGRQAIVQQRGS